MFCGNIVAQIYNKPRSNQKNPSFRFKNPPFLDPQKTPSGKKSADPKLPVPPPCCSVSGRREGSAPGAVAIARFFRRAQYAVLQRQPSPRPPHVEIFLKKLAEKFGRFGGNA